MRGKLLVKLLSAVVAAAMLLPLFYSVGLAEGQDNVVYDAGTTVEAENCTIHSAHGKIIEDQKASEGSTVELINGQPGGNRYVPTDDTWTGVTAQFRVTEAGTYAASMRYYSSSMGNDSFYYSFGTDDFVEGATTVCEDGEYHWKTLGTAYLQPGVYKVRIAVREQGMRIDQIKVGDSWGAPTVTGQTVYPELMGADSIGKVAKFEDGDRVAFIGDSITHGGYTHAFIYNYYATRYPNCDFTYLNKGINGDRAVTAQTRFNHDIYDADSDFNKVVIMLGTNDMSRGEYFAGKELLEGAETRRNNLIESYKTEYRKLLELVKAKNPQQVILVTPPMFDEWVPESNNETSPGFNNVVRKAGAIVYDFAQEYGYDFVDINTPQTIIDAYQRQSNVNFTFTPDRIHPSDIGHYIMAYSFLKAQGETGEVASVSVDAAQKTIDSDNASVANLSVTDSTVTYQYTPNSLPLGADETYRSVEQLLPITDELNRETIRVAGLKDGLYNIKMNDRLVMQATGAQLASGVNIADKQKNANQQVALTVLNFVKLHRKTMESYRNFVANEIQYISKYKLDAASNATLVSSAQAWIAANPSAASDIETLQKYLNQKAAESSTLAQLAAYEARVAELNKPVQCNVVIEYAGEGSVVQNSAVYEKFSLPQDTLSIIPSTNNGGISIARIAFSDANGVISEIPAAGGSVRAMASVVNNTAQDKEAILWVGMYQGDRLLNVKTVYASIPSGASVPMELSIPVAAGTDSIRAGVWDSLLNINPYVPSAVFPADENTVGQIWVGKEKLPGFSPEIMEYTYYLHKLDTRMPYVSAMMTNSFASAEVTQASTVGSVATVKAGGKTYTIRFINEPLPVLSALTVGGKGLDGFSPETYQYTYEATDGGDITVAAQAAEGLQIDVEQAGETGGTATVTVTAPFGSKRTYTVTFGKIGKPGEVTNIYRGGAPTTEVTSVPSLGAKLIDMYSAYATDAERIAAVKADDNPYENIAYAQYTNRSSQTAWDAKTDANNWLPNTYGTAIEFIYAQSQNSALISPNVTRLYKSTDDPCNTEEIAKKSYEFDISKDATVVITTNGQSAFIANQGWSYEKDAKYQLCYPNYTRIQDTSTLPEENYYLIPNGQVANIWSVSDGSAYLKHFKAGERVAVPAFDVNNSYRKNSIFIIWDECNKDAKLYDIMADGVSIPGFDPNVTEYTLKVAEGVVDVPQISVSATLGANAEVVQAQSLSESATVTACGKTYTIFFSVTDKSPGTISNVYWNGVATNAVYGVPSVGINPPDLYNGKTDAERIASVKALAGTEYDSDAYIAFSNRKIAGSWNSAGGGYYAYNLKFIYADNNSIFMDKNVTRLYKSDNDNPTESTASKIYEFDIDKGATVYISVTDDKYAQKRGECKSPFIESLGGWTYDYDVDKYGLSTWSFKEVTSPEKAYVPDGTVKHAWASTGSVYYKHFNAGERVSVPAYSATESYLQTSVFLIWDNLNTEEKIFDILADGISVGNFDPSVTSYTVQVERGTAVPKISVSATETANVEIVQAQSLDGSAIVTACGKTYTISFEQITPDMTLSSLMVDGAMVDGFDPAVKEYTVTLERGNMNIPQVKATAALSVNSLEVKQAVKTPGDAKVTVKTPRGASETYTVHFKKTGTPGIVSNIFAGGKATADVTAVPALGAEMIDMYHAYETDAERIAAVISPDNPYANTAYAQFTDRASEKAWKEKSGPAAEPANTYGAQSEFIYLNHPNSVLISPDNTRLYKSTTDPTGADVAKKSYEFDISKDATVYITTGGVSSFIAAQGWEYDNQAKYRLYYTSRSNGNIVDDPSAVNSRYVIPDGTSAVMMNANGAVYKKHFSKEERVAVPAFSEERSYRQTNVFIVWDDCNDERAAYGLKYKIGAETKEVEDFDLEKRAYDITLPAGTTQVPELWMMATRTANAQVTMPETFTNGKVTATVTVELESGTVTTYTVNFYVDSEPEDDVRLSSISYSGTAVEGFNPYTRSYAVDLPLGSSYPTVSAQTYNDQTPAPVIVQPSAENNGTATITVNSKNGSHTAVYTVVFTILNYNPAQATVLPVKNNAKSIVTIVHDDGDLPTVSYLDGEFEKNNLKGTVAMIASRVNDNNVSSWQGYFDTGRFNLANHSYTHAYWGQSDAAESGTLSDGKTYNIPAGTMTKEIITSGEYLREKFPNERVLSFVKPGFTFPSGKPQVSDKAYEMIRDNYICMRNTGGGMNTIPPADWDNVKSLMVQANSDVASPNNHTAAYWIDEVDKTIAQNGWLVFLFHNIVEDSQVVSGGLSVSQSKASILFDALGDRVENGDVWCAYLDEATMYIKESQTASVYAKKYQDASIGVVLTDKMDDAIYNYPLTVKVEVPQQWSAVSVTQNGAVTEIAHPFEEGGVAYVYANVVPDAGEATLTPAESGSYVTGISIGDTPIEGFSPAKHYYSVTLPVGTTDAPVVTAQGAAASVTQAALTDGKGSATVTAGTEVYTVFFEAEKEKNGPVVILKFDDLREGSGVRSAMQNAIDYVNEKGLKASVGVIGVSLEDDGTKTEYYNQIKGWVQSGNVEIWNHGYYHGNGNNGPEFNGGTYDEQYKQLTDTNRLLIEKCGVTATSFGAPGNATDATTLEVLKNVPQIKTTMFGRDTEGILNLTNSVEFEQTGTVDGTWKTWMDYQKFVASFTANKDKPYLLMQTHPLMWAMSKNDTQYKIFKDQINYLISQGVTFMTPDEYYQSTQN